MDFGAHGGVISDLDDGHIPENCHNVKTRLVEYPHFHRREAAVYVFENALPTPLVDSLYQLATQQSEPWGTYVTMEQVKSHWSNQPTKDSLPVALVAAYLEKALSPSATKVHCASPHHKPALLEPDDLDWIHGVAIWALQADVGSQVPYHLDYAEQIRYDSNLVVPPLVAGTLQCTQGTVQGGDFLISLQGIPHYRRHGYKAKKQDPNDLVSLGYRYNRILAHAGHLPHASNTIQHLQPTGVKRVICGFNAFGHDVGPTVQRAPEHSKAFRRKVQLQRWCTTDLDLQTIRANKPLAKLLVWAKREKRKAEFQQAQARLQHHLEQVFQSPQTTVTVAELMQRFGNDDYPRAVDVQVYLHHQVQQGLLHSSIPTPTGSILAPSAILQSKTR